jgi:hypothetical protein
MHWRGRVRKAMPRNLNVAPERQFAHASVVDAPGKETLKIDKSTFNCILLWSSIQYA